MGGGYARLIPRTGESAGGIIEVLPAAEIVQRIAREAGEALAAVRS